MDGILPTGNMKLDELWDFVIEATGVSMDGLHGPRHWARVERNGRFLAAENGGNPDVVSLFALFHDCKRVNDHIDPGHGARGAEYARSLRDHIPLISEEDFERLCEACEGHTDRPHHPGMLGCRPARSSPCRQAAQIQIPEHGPGEETC